MTCLSPEGQKNGETHAIHRFTSDTNKSLRVNSLCEIWGRRTSLEYNKKSVHLCAGTRRLLTAIVLADGDDRVLAIRPKNTLERSA